MYLKQVSVFVENSSGKLADILSLIGDAQIDIKALSIADTDQYGILRLVVDKPFIAEKILKENHYVVRVNDVLAISIANTPGGLCKALNLLREAQIDVNYLYAFVGTSGTDASVMLRIHEREKAEKIFKENQIALIHAEDMQDLSV